MPIEEEYDKIDYVDAMIGKILGQIYSTRILHGFTTMEKKNIGIARWRADAFLNIRFVLFAIAFRNTDVPRIPLYVTFLVQIWYNSAVLALFKIFPDVYLIATNRLLHDKIYFFFWDSTLYVNVKCSTETVPMEQELNQYVRKRKYNLIAQKLVYL